MLTKPRLAQAQPVVSGLVPTAAAVGATVVISGTGFSATAGGPQRGDAWGGAGHRNGGYGYPAHGAGAAGGRVDCAGHGNEPGKAAAGLVAGLGDPNQVLPLAVVAVSSDPALVSLGTMGYTSPAATGP